jgi:hypothetical protein
VRANIDHDPEAASGSLFPHMSPIDKPPVLPSSPVAILQNKMMGQICSFIWVTWKTITQRTTIADLPLDVLLDCFSFMELKSLIISRCVCAEWRKFVPQAPLLRERRRLLDLHYGIINTDYFLKTHDCALQHLQPFDRQAYINNFISQHPALPDNFRLWILEWPSSVVIHSMWPGLPHRLRPASRPGVNWLAAPQVSALVYHIGTPDVEFIPGILIWRTSDVATWLILDERPHLFGRVISLSTRGRPQDERGFSGTVVADWNNWVEYLGVEWNRFTMNSNPVNRPYTEVPLSDTTYSRRCGIRGVRPEYIPPLLWNCRHEGESSWS